MERGLRNQKMGEVVSNKMQKSIMVRVYRTVRHARYGKYIRQFTVFAAHDEKNEAKIGDEVLIEETRPMSKTKRWKLKKIVKAADAEVGVES